jgi:hypothetical protein
VERSRHDALRRDGEERLMRAIERMLVRRSAVTRGVEEVLVGDDADGAWMSGTRSHEAEDSIEEAPVAIEKGCACADEMLQDGPDMREGSRVAGE